MKHLFAATFTPVQDFIVEARRAQDLLAGSMILSELALAICQTLRSNGAELIFPARLTDDAPNKILALLPDAFAPEKASTLARSAFDEAWFQRVNNAQKFVDKWRVSPGATGRSPSADMLWRSTWQRQINGLWQLYWSSVPVAGAYGQQVSRLSALLEAAKHTRAFEQRVEPGAKDTLSGVRSALQTSDFGGDAVRFWSELFTHTLPEKPTYYFNAARLRPNGRERLDAIGVVKRFGLLTISTERKLDRIGSVSTIASADFVADAALRAPSQIRDHLRNVRALLEPRSGRTTGYFEPNSDAPTWPPDGDLLYDEIFTERRLAREYGLSPIDTELRKAALRSWRTLKGALGYAPCRYFAVLVMDGDSMGASIGACTSDEAHRAMSNNISDFVGEVDGIVEQHQGQRVYAGGDDVLALLPLRSAVACARQLREVFFKRVGVTLSAGIAVAHHQHPLDDVLKRAREAEGFAKEYRRAGDPQKPKDALCMIASKRSGELIRVRSGWESLDAFETAVSAFTASPPGAGTPQLSAKFAYDMRTLSRDFVAYSNPGAASAGQLTIWWKAMMRKQLSDHWNEDAVAARNELAAQLEAWAERDTPQMIADWLVIARFVAHRGEE